MIVSNKPIPVAMFAYNRPSHTAAMLSALQACHDVDSFEFHFFSDAAKRPEHDAAVREVRELLQQRAPAFAATIHERSENFGLARSIVDGVSRLCAHYGQVIVIEDDLILAPDFLRYMRSALEHYRDVPEVMQVSGYTIAPPPSLSCDAFLLPVTTTWGWATWARAWEAFSWQAEGWPESRTESAWLSVFDLGGDGRYTRMLEDRIAGRNDSWGILWWYAVSRARGLVVYPRHSLVCNDGFDGSGVHCGTSDPFSASNGFNAGREISTEIRFPDDVQVDPEHLKLLAQALGAAQSGVGAQLPRNVTDLLRKPARWFAEILRRYV